MKLTQTSIRSFVIPKQDDDAIISFLSSHKMLIKDFLLAFEGKISPMLKDFLLQNNFYFYALNGAIISNSGRIKNSTSNEAPAQKVLEEFQKLEGPKQYEVELTKKAKEGELKILRSHIRSGQEIEHDGDLVIFGNVNSGARVCTKGSLIIIGENNGSIDCGKILVLKRSKNALIIDGQILENTDQINENLDLKVIIKDIDNIKIIKADK
ncbi:MAG: septum site-determining protein MinC [Helicobacter sp.]|nr:septum site-determining protein MinC [Helicobacter sp.]